MTDPWAPPDRAPGAASWGGGPAAPAPRTWTWLTTDVLVVGIASLLVLGASSSLAVTRLAERPTADLRAAQAQLERRLPELIAFVERERGLRFREAVDARVLDDDAFVAELFSGEETEDDDSDPDATLTALGLLDEDEDLEDVVDEALGGGVVGFYDTEADRLVVRGEQIDAYVETVLVHELTHALQDQVFDLDRPELEDADDERFTGFQSLVEGDATRVESAWRESRPADVQADINREEQRRFGGGSREPSVVDVLLGFPYYAGEPLAEALLEDGQDRLDRAFRSPPTTTEQVLRPDDPDLEPVVVPDPTGAGKVVDEGVLGAAGLALLTLSDPTADGPHLGWDGDRYATFDDDGEVCTVVDVVAEGRAARDALVSALGAWADSVDGTVEPRGEQGLRLRSCAG